MRLHTPMVRKDEGCVCLHLHMLERTGGVCIHLWLERTRGVFAYTGG